MEHTSLLTLIHAVIWLVMTNACYGTLSDIQCLKRIHKSVSDPNGYLATWDFNNNTEGAICRLTGVECWHPDESRVLNLRLGNMGLQGQFPSGLENCSSLTGLDLSNNNFTGPIPWDVSKRAKFVTSLDLSYNSFSGEIPADLANCSYLNILNLQHNRLSGSIPQTLGLLIRLTTFNVADNSLTGKIPSFVHPNISTNYANNAGLCGGSLGPCKGAKKKCNAGVVQGCQKEK